MTEIVKAIYLEPAWKLRKTSYIQAFFLYPPEGYKFIVRQGVQNNIFDFLSKYGVSFQIQSFLTNIFPLQLLKSYAEKFNPLPKEACLTYSLDHLVLRKEPWILEMGFEPPWILCGTENQLEKLKEKVRKVLFLANLKKIIFPIEKGKEAFLEKLGRDLKEKVKVISEPVIPRTSEKVFKESKVKLLFVNSGNINNDYIFYIKGGAEVIEAFLKLQKKYKDIELTIRSPVPKSYKERCSRFKNIKIIEKPIPWEELEEEWKTADIFIHPHHGNMSHALLDALSYGLPVVTTDTWATSELIEDGKTGFLVHNPRAARFTEGPIFHFTTRQYRKEVIRGPELAIIEGLVEKISILIENPELRHKMSKEAQEEVESGKHSLKRRNEKLKKILNEAIEN